MSAAVSEAIILLRSAGQPGKTPQDSVFCAGISDGAWVRLSPLSFHGGQHATHLKRWDKLRFATQSAAGESRIVTPQSLQIVGELPPDERGELLEKMLVKSLAAATKEGKTLALIAPKEAHFQVQKKTETELKEETATQTAPARRPYSYRFRYRYKTEDGTAESTFEDGEMNGTMARLSKSFGEPGAIARLIKIYGKELPKQGMYFVMSRANAKDTNWIITAVIGMEEVGQSSAGAGNLDLVC